MKNLFVNFMADYFCGGIILALELLIVLVECIIVVGISLRRKQVAA